MRVPVAPHSRQYLMLLVFWIGYSNRFVVVSYCLICISSMIYDVECLLISFFAICISSLVRCLFASFAHFLIRFVCVIIEF